MNNNYEYPWYCTWKVIIIAFIFFWPVGIALLLLRNSSNQNKQSVFLGTTDKKKYVGAGIGLILVGIMIIKDAVVWGLFMIAGGVVLIIYAEKLKKKAERNRQYIELVVNREETSIDKISSICNMRYDIVVKELQFLINRNVLKNAIIDSGNHTITVSKPAVAEKRMEIPFLNGVTHANEQVTCSCPGCGANVVAMRGTVINCEYCDTPITVR